VSDLPAPRGARSGRVVVGVVLAAIVALGVAIWSLINTAPTAVTPPTPPTAQPTTPLTVPPTAPATTADAGPDPFPPIEAPQTRPGEGRGSLTVAPDATFEREGLVAEVRDAWVDRAELRSWAYAHLLVRNARTGADGAPATSVRALRIDVAVLDASGAVLTERSQVPVSTVSPAMYPDETVPIEVAIEVSTDAASLRVAVVEIERGPYAAAPKAAPLALRSLVTVPPEVGVEVRMRDVVRDLTTDGRYADRVVLEVTNVGSVALRGLTLKVARFDERGELVQVDPVVVARPDGIPLFEAETRVVSSLELFAAPIADFKVELAAATPVNQ
jgi:hypothetical protein